MENAADALKTAFAVLVFIIAITIIFVMISKVRSTADVVLYYSDKTNFYSHYDSKESNREVNVSDIVATLYRYDTESLAVTVNLDSGTYYFDLGYETNLIGKTINTQEEREENLGKFISDKLNDYKDKKFKEEFSEITLSSGGKKVYITYSLYTEK